MADCRGLNPANGPGEGLKNLKHDVECGAVVMGDDEGEEARSDSKKRL
jgi:hypothetical protein